jgi:uncharacterized protein YfaP (DUF2135 family)
LALASAATKAITYSAEGTFTGTVNGRKETLIVTATGSGEAYSDSAGEFIIRYIFVGGSDDLSSVKGTVIQDIEFYAYYPGMQAYGRMYGTYSADLIPQGGIR